MKILSIIEATTVNGPAKNLLSFCSVVRSPEFRREVGSEIEVTLITFDRRAGRTSESSPNDFVKTARDQKVTVDVIEEGFRFDPRALTQLREIVERHHPDVIQTHMIKSHFLIKLSGLAKKYPWVAFHHGYTTTDMKMQFYNQLNRWSLPSADLVITACHAFATQQLPSSVREDRIRVRHNAVVAPRIISTDEKLSLRERFGVTGDEKVVLAVGRLSREKGHADLIDSVALLRAAEPDLKFKLLIVGDGPEQANLARAVTERKIASQVVFVGHVTDVAPFYAIADVLALPSHSEGSPNVLLEAMAAGLPVVATSVGGVPEIATSEVNALLVPAGDPSTFAEALRRALTELELARTLKRKAITRAGEFSPESHAQSLIQIYQELVSVPRPIANGSYTHPGLPDPVATTTPRGLPTRAPRIVPGTDTI